MGSITFEDVFTLWPTMGRQTGYWFQPRGDFDRDRFVQIHRGEAVPDVPVELRVTEGRKLTDVIRNSSLFLIVSKWLLNEFNDRRFTGFHTFPVRLFDRTDNEIGRDYTGLAITGRSGPLDTARSVTKWFAEADGTKKPLCMSGFYFDLRRWDGSDLFLLDDHGGLLITRRVLDALTNLKATGWRAEPVSEYRL